MVNIINSMRLKDKLRLGICLSTSDWSNILYNKTEMYEKFDTMLKEIDEECRTTLVNFEKYALDYYNNIFNNDSEIHAIVNFANKTTSKLVSNGYNLYLTIYDYVKNEEHSAKTLFSGNILADYIIYLDNGDIEKIK